MNKYLAEYNPMSTTVGNVELAGCRARLKRTRR